MDVLLQLVPRLPPPADGVGSTAMALAEGLSALGVANRVRPASASDLTATLTAEQPSTVLLHYVNYGYDPRGCPLWLADQLERWLHATPGARLWLYAHEVYASGPPWRRAFWHNRRQREVAGRLVRSASFTLTSLDIYKTLLLRLGATDEIEVRPIVSSVGEETAPLAYAEREPCLVVFGSCGVRMLAYGQARRSLERALRSLAIERIVDIGPGSAAPRAIGGLPVESLGESGSQEIGRVLATCKAGFLAYPLAFLGKSSIFASYAAHGALPICAGRRPADDSTPIAGRHFWQIDRAREAPPDPGAIAGAAWAWYRTHDLAALARSLRDRARTA